MNRRTVILLVAALLAVPFAASSAPTIIVGFASYITGRPAASSPSGAEVLPLVQNGGTTKFSLSALGAYVASFVTPTSIGALTPAGSGAQLTGITPAQVGALAPTGNGAQLTGITPAQIGAQPLLGFLPWAHVAGNAGVAGLNVNFVSVARVDGFVAAGDGGAHVVAYDPVNACGSGGHPVADGVTCVNSTFGGAPAGSWNIDWTSVPYAAANPCLFENCYTSTNDSAAIKAAVATLRPVYLPDILTTGPKREYAVDSDIYLYTPGQRIFGDGRFRSRIRIGIPNNFSRGVFVAALDATGTSCAPVNGGYPCAPGPDLRDFGIYFNQPDPNTTALIQYPPAFYLENNPAFNMTRMGCYVAWRCVDMTGNSGGSLIDDFDYDAFYHGIEADGSLDAVEWRHLHWFPNYLTANQSMLFGTGATSNGSTTNNTTPVALYLGRIDDWKVNASLFFGGLAIDQHLSNASASSVQGTPGFGSVGAGTDFDNYGAINISAGSIHVSGVKATLGNGGILFQQSGGILDLDGLKVLAGAGQYLIYQTGGDLTLANSTFECGSVDIPVLATTSGAASQTLTGNKVFKSATTAFSKTVFTLGGGVTMAANNYISMLTTGSGTAWNVGNDNGGNRMVGNSAVGYPAWQPSSPKGLYGYNY